MRRQRKEQNPFTHPGANLKSMVPRQVAMQGFGGDVPAERNLADGNGSGADSHDPSTDRRLLQRVQTVDWFHFEPLFAVWLPLRPPPTPVIIVLRPKREKRNGGNDLCWRSKPVLFWGVTKTPEFFTPFNDMSAMAVRATARIGN